MIRPSLVALSLPLAALLLTGCATPEARLRAGLVDAGLSRPMAACMAERMADRLSLLQLKRLGSLANFKDESLRTMSTERFLRNVRALEDPEILAVATTSAGICALG
ncbi:MAG: hypothetical protein GW859_05500 [Sphingomonadales bacterium]|nr:hypothetical protein [Sphingomonadales bacterium]